jgi:hypothetical protein
MTIGGWILLVLSWGIILGFTFFCFAFMIRSGKI